jgi:hypothetical protein
MQDPNYKKQEWLFNYMDPAYDASYDDMDSEDFDSMWNLAEQDAEYEAYLNTIETEMHQ